MNRKSNFFANADPSVDLPQPETPCYDVDELGSEVDVSEDLTMTTTRIGGSDIVAVRESLRARDR